MHIIKAFTAIALPVSTMAAGVTILNNCPDSLWAVSVKAGGEATGRRVIGPHGIYHEEYTEQGRALKLFKDAVYPTPLLNLGYSYTGGVVWTSLSTIPSNQSPFKGTTVTVKGVGVNSPTDCRDIVWVNGTAPLADQVNFCRWDTGITLTLCA